MFAIVLAAIAIHAQAPDTGVVAAVRRAAAAAPLEAIGADTGRFTLGDIALLDVDGDGAPEAFVVVHPAFRQTPTVVVYRYSPARGAEPVYEALVPGRLMPVSGKLTDPHTLGAAVDLMAGNGRDPIDTLKMVKAMTDRGFSAVRYRTFFHADMRTGVAHYVDLADRALPSDSSRDCSAFEFSRVQALVAGRLAGDRAHRYLVALTEQDITIYRFDGFGPHDTLRKETWMRARPEGAAGLSVDPEGAVVLRMASGPPRAIGAP